MEKFLIIYRGAAGGPELDSAEHNHAIWSAWFNSLGGALVDRGSLTHASVEVPSRLMGPKLSSSSLTGYSIIAAADFNAAVKLAEACPIFDEHGSVEIARLTGVPA